MLSYGAGLLRIGLRAVSPVPIHTGALPFRRVPRFDKKNSLAICEWLLNQYGTAIKIFRELLERGHRAQPAFA